MESRVDRANGTYVYGVIAGPPSRLRRAAGRRSKSSLPGTGPVRLIALEGDLHAVVADAPLRLYGQEALARKLSDLEWVSRAAVAHETVLESFADAAAVVPMKLFTLFTSDDRALAHLRAEHRRIDATVKRVAHHHEFGVRVILDRRPVASAPGRTAGRPTGLSYLKEKKAQRDLTRELAVRAGETVDGLFDRLASRATLAKRRPASELSAGGGRLLLDAAFLVSRSKARAFGSAVAREMRSLGRDGYAITMTGPWPPYSFIDPGTASSPASAQD
jgi:hypothetical protein